ncbi:MAG: esterase [Candidatus Eremiobacteraeota bacterium]|nr:esterase [Candidatus Eremiobacteraeota bacterium]
MRRGALLKGLAAATTTSLAGCSPPRAIGHVGQLLRGCVDTSVPPVDNVLRLVRGTFRSRHVAVPVGYAIVVPNGLPRPSPYVAYVLPGRGSTAESVLAMGLPGLFAERMRANGHAFNLAIVDAGESYFHSRTSGEDRLAMVTVDFPRVVREVIGSEILREALIGQSMGGYGALLAAEREPERYRAVAVAGPAIFPSYADEHRSVGDAFDSPDDFARHDVLAHAASLRTKPVLIVIGQRDPFLTGARMFVKACPTAALDVQKGCHDDGFWRTSAPELLQFVGAALTHSR